MTPLLQITGASKHFGGLFAVEDVTLTVHTGEIHCLIGPNGAGKSTLFKVIVGTYPPSAGRIVFRGTDITEAKPFARVIRGMSIKLQAPSVFKTLPVRQNLHIALQDHVARAAIRAEEDRLLGILGLAAEGLSAPQACSPTANSNGWRSVWPSPSVPSCCCSTSPPPGSHRKRPSARANSSSV